MVLEDKDLSLATWQDLQHQGFQTIAKSGTPWTEQEKEKLNTALANLKEDPTISGDYKKVERWLSWAVLGGSRCEGAVRRRLDVLLRAKGALMLIDIECILRYL